MRNLWQVFTYELKRNITRKAFLFATFGMPLLAIVAFYAYPLFQTWQASQTPSDEPNGLENLVLGSLEKAGYVDESGVFTDLNANLAQVLIAYPDEQSARAALNADEIDAFYIIPSDYLESGDMTLHVPNINFQLFDDGEALAKRLAYATLASDLNTITLHRLENPTSYVVFDLSAKAEDNQGTSSEQAGGQFAIIYVFQMIFFFSIFMTNTYLMQTVVEERENRIIEILISTIRPVQLLGGKILAMATIGFFQLIIWLGVLAGLAYLAINSEAYQMMMTTMGIANFQVQPVMIVLMVIYFILMYILYAAIFGTIGAVSGSAQEGSQYAGFLVLPVLMPIYFFSLIQAEPNGLLAMAFTVIPFTTSATTLARMIITDVPIWQIAISVSGLALTTIGAIWMAGRIFRVQTLLAGTKLKVTDIPRLIFAKS